MKFRILSAILRSAWMIDERFALVHGGVIAGLINGMEMEDAGPGADEDPVLLPFAVSKSEPGKVFSRYDDAPLGSMAVIPVHGPLMKSDQEDCGYLTSGMATLSKRVKEAEAHPNISGIILHIDSPGGTVDGTQSFAESVKSTSKPVVAFVDGLMASAALWIGSAADYIIAENTTTEVGSIGVMVQFADMQPMWEREGVKFHRIAADQSKDKNKDYTDALKGDYDTIKKQSLNPLADEFISAVKTNRGNKITSDEVFTGKIYLAAQAVELGLIDEIGSFETAVDKISQLANSKRDEDKSKPEKQKKQSKFLTMQITRICAVLGVEQLELSDDGVFLNEEQLTAIEARFEEANALLTERDTIANGLSNSVQENMQLQADIDTAKARITELEAELAESRSLAAAHTAVVSAPTDPAASSEATLKQMEQMSMSERIAFLKTRQ